jgi:hypothetical protein
MASPRWSLRHLRKETHPPRSRVPQRASGRDFRGTLTWTKVGRQDAPPAVGLFDEETMHDAPGEDRRSPIPDSVPPVTADDREVTFMRRSFGNELFEAMLRRLEQFDRALLAKTMSWSNSHAFRYKSFHTAFFRNCAVLNSEASSRSLNSRPRLLVPRTLAIDPPLR